MLLLTHSLADGYVTIFGDGRHMHTSQSIVSECWETVGWKLTSSPVGRFSVYVWDEILKKSADERNSDIESTSDRCW